MNTPTLLDHYRATPATEQAQFLTTLLAGLAHSTTGNYGPCATLDPRRPRCPACRRKVTDLVEVDVSTIEQDARIATTDDGEPYIDACAAETGDYHVAFFLTACCRAAVTIPPECHIEFT